MSNEKISRGERKRNRHFNEQIEEREGVKLSQLNNETLIQPTEDYFTLELEKIKLNDKLPDKEKKRLEKLAIETEKNKKEIAIQLRKTPIVQFACERTGIGRSTYYKWRAKDKIFGRVADRALEAGRFFINDLAESKLISLIQNSQITAIIFWLKHNHPKYAEVNRIIHEYEIVTDKPSVEEEHVVENEIARMMSVKMTPKFTVKEMREKVEEEEIEAEMNIKKDKRLISFEEEEENKK